MAVQFCGTCGHPLIPEQLFCQHCGSRTDENATRGAPPVTPGIPVSSVGTLYCGECGALVGSQDRVCRRCGARVEPPIEGVSDPSLSDLPTMMGTPPPGEQAAPPAAAQTPPSPGYQTPTGYQAPSASNWPPDSMPAYPSQQPQGWGASYSPAPSYNESPTFTLGAPPPGAQTPPPYRPAPPRPGGPPRRGQSWLVVVAVVLVILVLIVGGGILFVLHPFGGNQQTNGITPTASSVTTQTPGVTPTTPPSPTAVVLNTETASNLVQQFYAYINAKNYDAAYDLLSTEWHQKQSRDDFANGYQNLIQDTLTIDSAEQQGVGTIQVDIHLQAQETGGTKNFAGYYLVTIENGQLVLLSAKVNQI